MIQVKKQATREQIKEARYGLADTGQDVLLAQDVKKLSRIDAKIAVMITDLIDAYKDRGWEWPWKPWRCTPRTMRE
jgi:hypothetical protein